MNEKKILEILMKQNRNRKIAQLLSKKSPTNYYFWLNFVRLWKYIVQKCCNHFLQWKDVIPNTENVSEVSKTDRSWTIFGVCFNFFKLLNVQEMWWFY